MGILRKIATLSTAGVIAPRSQREKLRLAETKESKARAKLLRAEAKAIRRG
jgi:hypothetical protein